jgi:hypothetical protein
MPKLQQCKEDLGEKMTWKSSTASKVIGKTHTPSSFFWRVSSADSVSSEAEVGSCG